MWESGLFSVVNMFHLVLNISEFYSCYALVKVWIFSTHSMTYIWYSPQTVEILHVHSHDLFGHFLDICSQNVTILPYPTAVVKQDSNLTLYCSYHGYYRPETLTIWEWKLDGNTFGFLYQRGNETLWPFGVMFDQTLYRYNCTSDFTTLTILNVGEERHNETWGCSVRLGQEFYESDSTIVYVEGKQTSFKTYYVSKLYADEKIAQTTSFL